MAFYLWIGMGTATLGHFLTQRFVQYLSVITVAFGLPLWMLFQNLDDHDRSGCILQIANARSIPDSCARNAILFTGGDNGTFPLQYLQEEAKGLCEKAIRYYSNLARHGNPSQLDMYLLREAEKLMKQFEE